MAQSLLASRPPGTRLHLDCSTRTLADQVFGQAHAALAQADPSFTLKRRQDDVDGRITKAEVRDAAARFPGAKFVLCGPPAYVSAVQAWLLGAGVAKGRIHVERFFLPPGAARWAAPGAAQLEDLWLPLGRRPGRDPRTVAPARARIDGAAPWAQPRT
jgi:ferredoxin-NADP reductase